MTTGKLLATAGILLALVSLSFLPAAAQSYTVTDLGSLGGKGSGAYAVNDIGQVAGVAHDSSEIQHAFVWSARTGLRDLGFLPGSFHEAVAYSINNLGQAVGSCGVSAFLWTQSQGMQDLGGLGGVGTVAYGINNVGQVVGYSNTSGNQQHAFIWSASQGMQDLGTLGGNGSEAFGINDSGQVVGESFLSGDAIAHAFLWTQSGGMQDLGSLGGTFSAAHAINGSGQVVGSYVATSGQDVAFIWDQTNGMRSIGGNSSALTVATAINVSGLVVGEWLFIGAQEQREPNLSPPNHQTSTGFLWTKVHQLQNLNALLVNTEILTVTANGINKAGQIAATGNNLDAILLTPTK